jgi:hypothetical protein
LERYRHDDLLFNKVKRDSNLTGVCGTEIE